MGKASCERRGARCGALRRGASRALRAVASVGLLPDKVVAAVVAVVVAVTPVCGP